MTTEARRTTASRRELLESFRRGYLRATYLGIAPNPLPEDPAETSDAEIERRLFDLARWVRTVERTDLGYVWGEMRRAGALEGLALREGEDAEAAVGEWRLVLTGWYECRVAMGALV